MGAARPNWENPLQDMGPDPGSDEDGPAESNTRSQWSLSLSSMMVLIVVAFVVKINEATLTRATTKWTTYGNRREFVENATGARVPAVLLLRK